MKEVECRLRITVKSNEELTDDEVRLVEAAKNATNRSYAPYSNFRVGAAVLLEDGTVIEGNNQENSAYPSGMCAERTAVFYAHSLFPNKAIKCLCVAARNVEGRFLKNPVTPCGACRQVLAESEKRGGPIRVILYGADCTYVIESAGSLLPLQFDGDMLLNR